MSDRNRMERAEQSMPWVIYVYGRTHDGWWPFWNSTRFLGRASLDLECSVCGNRTRIWYPIPRFGKVPEPLSGRHPLREKYLAEHAHLVWQDLIYRYGRYRHTHQASIDIAHRVLEGTEATEPETISDPEGFVRFERTEQGRMVVSFVEPNETFPFATTLEGTE